MKNSKAILIVHPMVSPLTSLLNWSEQGYKVIGFYLAGGDESEYIKKGISETHFDVKLFSKGELDKDIQQIREQQLHYDIEYGYIGGESGVIYGEKILHAIFPTQSNDPNTSLWRFSKYAMNERLKDCGLPYIKQCRIIENNITPEIEKFLQEVSYPVVVKPSFNSAGSESVYFCNSAQEVLQRLKDIGTKGFFGRVSEVIIQEKVSGTEYFIDAFNYAGEFKFSTVILCEKYTIRNMPIYRALSSIEFNSQLYNYLAKQVQQILQTLDVKYGFSHTEVMLTPENEVKLIEVNLRPSGLGGFINDVVYDHQKVNQYTLACDFLNKTHTKIEKDDQAYTLFLLNNLGFTYKRVKIELMNAIKSYRNIRILKPSCDKKPEKTWLTDSVAIIHLSNFSTAQLREDMALLERYEKEGTLFEQ